MVKSCSQTGISRCRRSHSWGWRETVKRFYLKMIRVPLILRHGFEWMCISSSVSNFGKDSLHTWSNFMGFWVENEGVLGYIVGEETSGGSANIICIEGKANRVIDGDDLTLIVLTPVLDKGNIRGWFEGYRKIVIYHLQLAFSINYKWKIIPFSNKD